MSAAHHTANGGHASPPEQRDECRNADDALSLAGTSSCFPPDTGRHGRYEANTLNHLVARRRNDSGIADAMACAAARLTIDFAPEEVKWQLATFAGRSNRGRSAQAARCVAIPARAHKFLPALLDPWVCMLHFVTLQELA